MFNTILTACLVAYCKYSTTIGCIVVEDRKKKVNGISITGVSLFASIMAALIEPNVVIWALNSLFNLGWGYAEGAMLWIACWFLIPFDVNPRRLDQIVLKESITEE